MSDITSTSNIAGGSQILNIGPTGSGPKGTTSLYAGIDAVLAIIGDFMHALNALQIANATLMEQISQEEVAQNQLFEKDENSPTPIKGDPYSNDLYMLEHATSAGDQSKYSAMYQDDNTKNQALIKNIDSVYQQWQGAVNQNNQNQQPILAVGSAITQFIANFLRYIHA